MKRKNPFHWLSIMLTLGWLSAGFASAGQAENEEGLEMLLFMDVPEVVTSTMTEKNSIKAPSTMTVVTEDEIKNMGARSLMELLDRVSGFAVKKADTSRQLITFRGIRTDISNDKFKLLLNGQPISEPIWGDFSDYFNIQLDNVKQIEIVRGPGSALYGTNAFAGIVNIITKKPSESLGTQVNVGLESNSTYKADAVYGYAKDNVEFGVELQYLDTNGADEVLNQDVLAGTPLTLTPRALNEEEKRFYGRADLRVSDLSVQAAWVGSTLQDPIPQLGMLTEKGEEKKWDFGVVEAKYKLTLSDSMSLTPRVAYTRTKVRQNLQALPRGFVIPVDIDGDGDLEFFPNGAFAQADASSDHYESELLMDYKVSDVNELLLGAFYEKIELSDVTFKSSAHPLFLFNLDTTVDFSSTLPWIAEKSRDIKGLFFQDEWRFQDQWYLVLGGRFDDYNDFGSTFNPRVGLVWDFNQKGGVAKLLYGSAFKAPTFSQLYNQNNPSVVGNPNLDAETLTSIEASLSYIFAGKLFTSLTAYSVRTKDLIDVSDTRSIGALGSTPFVFVNKGETESKGFEWENRYVFKEKNYIYASYAYTDAKDRITDEELPFIPDSQANFGVNLFFAEHVNFNAGLDFLGKLPREEGNPRGDVPSESVVDVTLRFVDVLQGWDISLSGYNITDEEVVSPSSLADFPLSDIPRPGATYGARASKKF